MSTHITVLPASTAGGRETIRSLLASPAKPSVRGIYRDPSKAPAEFTGNPRFEAVKGDVGSGTGLDFTGSSAVLYVPPPTYDGTPTEKWATSTASYVKSAIEKAGSVKRVVVHSALASQYDHGIGVLALNHITDRILKASAPEVVIARPGSYYSLWSHGWKPETQTLEMPIWPADYQIPMLSVNDIGSYLAKTLLDDSPKPSHQEVKLFGPRLYTANDVKNAYEEVTGKKVNLLVIPPEDLGQYFRSGGIPEAHLADFVEFTTAQLEGGIGAGDYEYDESTIRCPTELVDGIRDALSK